MRLGDKDGRTSNGRTSQKIAKPESFGQANGQVLDETYLIVDRGLRIVRRPYFTSFEIWIASSPTHRFDHYHDRHGWTRRSSLVCVQVEGWKHLPCFIGLSIVFRSFNELLAREAQRQTPRSPKRLRKRSGHPFMASHVFTRRVLDQWAYATVFSTVLASLPILAHHYTARRAPHALRRCEACRDGTVQSQTKQIQQIVAS